jgi:DNA-binding MarR family transcriptional regulator
MSKMLNEYKPETNISFHKDIRFHPDLTFGEKMFYAEIQSMSKKNNCPFSSRKLSEFFGVSHQTILNWVKKLVDLDLLEVGTDYKNQDCRQFLKAKNKK